MQSVKCVVVGDGGVGKTSLLISYTTSAFPGDYIPRVLDSYSANVMMGITPVNLGLWDTSAVGEDHERFPALLYPGANVFFLCYSDRRSWENIKTKWHPKISHHCPGTPFLLVSTKSDLAVGDDELIVQRMLEASSVTREEGQELANSTGVVYKIGW